MANIIPYGFFSLKDKFDTSVVEAIPEVSAAIDASLAEHNRQLQTAYNLFVEDTTEKQTKFKSPTIGRMTAADEYARAIPVKGYSKYTVAWPLQKGIIGTGMTREAAIKMTVREAAEEVMKVQVADIRWNRDLLLGALFNDDGWTHSSEEDGDLTIEGLANGDTTVYQIQSGKDEGATDNHLLFQNAAIDNSNDPFLTIHDELLEHPENSGEVVCLIPSNLKAAITALSAFYPISDPRIRLGSGQAELIAQLGVSVPGKVLGYHDDGVWIVEWPILPSSYLIATCTGGARSIRRRQDTAPQLQGLQRIQRNTDHPLLETQFERIVGYGGWNRVGALIMELGDTSYGVPTGYACPLS